MKEKIVLTVLLITMLMGCNSQPSTPTSIPVDEASITPFKSPITEIFTITPFPPTATNALQPTQTPEPDRLVNKQDGQEFISSQYGFSITFPSDMEMHTTFSDNHALVAGYLPQKHLDDGGDIVPWIEVIVRNQENGCSSILKELVDAPTEEKQETLGKISFTKIYTPSLYGDKMQGMEYMTESADFCVHIYSTLTTFYFDQGNAIPGDMIPYVQDKLNGIVSTFQWLNP